MLDSLNSIEENLSQEDQLEFKNRRRVNYYEARKEEDSFNNNSVIDPLDEIYRIM